MTESAEPAGCTCPPLAALLTAYADGDEVPCAVHRPVSRPAASSLALNDDRELIGRIRGALGPGERFRSDSTDPLD